MSHDSRAIRDATGASPAVEALRRIAEAMRSEMPPEYVTVLRGLPEGERVRQAFGLWRMARDALVRQGLRRGLSMTEAQADAARRLLAQADDPTA